MKRTFFLAATALLMSFSSFAQEKYCDVCVYQPGFKNYCAEVNYGETPSEKFKTIKDDQGNKIKFVSEIAALNYFTKQGWQLVSVYRYKGESHFFLKK